MSVARRLRVAVKMTDCPPSRGTAVSPALAPDPAEPFAFILADAPPADAPPADAPPADTPGACAGKAAGAPPTAPVPLTEVRPDEQPAASRQAPTVSRSVQAAARRGRGRGAVKRDTGAVMPMGRQRWHAGSHGYVTTWYMCWSGGATLLARGSDPPEPPDGLRPGSFVTGPGPCWS